MVCVGVAGRVRELGIMGRRVLVSRAWYVWVLLGVKRVGNNG